MAFCPASLLSPFLRPNWMPLLLALLRPADVLSIIMSRSNWATAPKSVITNLPWAEVVSTNGSLMLLNFTPIFSNCPQVSKDAKYFGLSYQVSKRLWYHLPLVEKSSSPDHGVPPWRRKKHPDIYFSRRLLPAKVRRSVNWGFGIWCLPSHIQIAYPV